MGQQSSSSREVSDSGDSPKKSTKSTDNEDSIRNGSPALIQGTKPVITDAQKIILKDTWKYIHDDVQRVGVVTFIGSVKINQ